MKKVVVLISCLFCFGVISAQSVVQNIDELAPLDYTVGQAVFIGVVNGQNVYRAPFVGKSKRETSRHHCKKGVGCCKLGYVEYFEGGAIISFTSYNGGDACGTNGVEVKGQMYIDSGETWIE